MKLRYWLDFNKRQNSTKRPDLNQGTEINVYLKDNTSLDNPVFIVSGELRTWSYCYAPSLSRYYFITDIVSISRDQFEVHCVMDAAATYRSEILAYNAFVERAASYYDVMVPDHALSMQQDIIYSGIAGSETRLDSTGTFIVPLAGKTGLQMVMFSNLAAAGAFFNGLQVEGPDGTIPAMSVLDDIFTSIGFQFFNAQDYMGAPYWIPVSYADLIGSSATLSIGMFGTTITEDLADAFAFPPITGALNIPSNYYDDFRSRDPRYSQYFIWLPGVGEVPLDSAAAAEGNLYFTMSLDVINGNVNYILETTGGALIGSFDGNLSVPLPFGQIKMDYSAPIRNAASGAISGAVHGGVAGAAIGAASGFIQGVDALLHPQVSIMGTGGNKVVIQDHPDIYVSLQNYGSTEFPVTEYGRPLCQNVRLGDLSGFVKCGNASVPLVALDHTRSEINQMLNTGIYIE